MLKNDKGGVNAKMKGELLFFHAFIEKYWNMHIPGYTVKMNPLAFMVIRLMKCHCICS